MKHFFIVMCVFFLGACGLGPPYDPEVNQTQVENQAQYFQAFSHQVEGEKIYGVQAGQKCAPAILFIHGAPGNWQAWGQYLADFELSNASFMMSVDRPGYGFSTGEIQDDNIKKQARLITEAALQTHKGPFLLVGHSYGGPIALQMAIDYPDAVSGIVMLAAAIDPDLHASRWYHRFAKSFLVRWAIPHDLKVANKEMVRLKTDLQKQSLSLSDVSTPMTFVQGAKDWLVPKENIRYGQQNLTNSPIAVIELKKEGHFLPWNQYFLVKQTILSHIEKFENACNETKGAAE